LSHESRRALRYGAEEADRLKHERIAAGHLLLGLLRDEHCAAAELLREYGLRLQPAREEVALGPEGGRPHQRPAADLHQLVAQLPQHRLEAATRVLRALCQDTVAVALAGPEACYSVFFGGAPAPLENAEPAAPPAAQFSDKARRALLFARYEADQLGSPAIESHHILLGLFREDAILAGLFVGSREDVEELRREVEERTLRTGKISASSDVPFSEEAKRALAFGAQGAGALGSPCVGTADLLLGLLREENCFAAELLKRRGVDLSRARQELLHLAREDAA
jgi:ATP-dependent Clp protease ATP-binding subunit ClpA